jgi:hypothetical protein
MSNLSSEDTELAVLNLEQVLLEHSIHPKFPYPLFLITSKVVRTIIPCVRSVKELPEHYFKKLKDPITKNYNFSINYP